MAEYIKRETAIEIVKSGGYWEREDMEVAVACIEQTPTADVVEVVRCKDCKGCELRYPAKAIGEEAIEGYYCHPNQRYVKSTDFCSYGERKR